MKLGIYGGTFDPVHLAHLVLAETVRERCGLDEVWFLPAFANPLKEHGPATPPAARLEMVRFAIAGHPQFRVSDLEVKKRKPSYTVESLEEIRQRNPDAELHLLMGADSLHDFCNWKDPRRILELAKVVAVNRGRGAADPSTVLDQLGSEWAERIELLEMPALAISATDLRERCARGETIRYLTPRSVELYILQNQLYQSAR